MGQINIVRRGGEYFREYEIEPGDNLIRICLRFGHRDWRKVYDHPENAAFRKRFPDPNQIDFVKPVNLLIPLAGAASTSVRVRGAPITDYMVARIKDDTGAPLKDTELRLQIPGQPHQGWGIITSLDGDIVIPNPEVGEWFLTSAEYELMPATAMNQSYSVEDIATIRKSGSLLDPTYHYPLTRNGIDDIVARRVFYLVCPMCGVTFKTVKPAATGPSNVCPNDGFNLTSLEKEIEADEKSFSTSPKRKKQDPKGTPFGLKCRGVKSMLTAHQTVTVYWDESRFVSPDGGDYTLWGRSPSGKAKTVTITGRATWGATAPNTTDPDEDGRDRSYEFHATPAGASTAGGKGAKFEMYTSAIPNNETEPLSNVLRWMTIHHTADPAQNGYVTARDLQIKHRDTDGIEGEGLAADIAYHFIIDSDGSIYEGRPLGIKGAHVGFFNGGNIGIVMAGNFQPNDMNHWPPAISLNVDTPTAVALAALENLVDVMAWRFNIKSVWSHRERKQQLWGSAEWTYCPGDNLIPYVNSLRLKYPGPPA
jgi:hypothetical protein